MALESWLAAARGPGAARIALTELAGALERPDRDPEQVVREAFARRHLRVESRLERTPISRSRRDDERFDDRIARRDELSWIAIRLAYDDDPGVGVAYARYEVTLPDGATRSGRLDRDGNARLDDIPPGTCEVVFPDHDKRKGAPPAKVSPGKGHTPRRRDPRAPPPASPPPVTKGPMSCHGVALTFESTTGRNGIDRRVQVVAVPDRRSVHELSVPFSLDAMKKHEGSIGKFSALAKALASGGLDAALLTAAVLDGGDDARKKRAERGGATKGARAVSKKMLYDRFHGGRAAVTLRPSVDGGCAGEHARVVIEGEAPLPVGGAETPVAMLPWRGGGDPWELAAPTKYLARASGCAGDSEPLTIEVLPGDQLLLAASLDLKVELTAGWFVALKRLLEDALRCSLEGSVSVEGRLEYVKGWREERDWRAFFAEEYRLRPGGRFEARSQVSLLSLAAGPLPATFLRHAGDLGVFIEVNVPFALKADAVSKRYAGGGPEGERRFKGGVELGPKGSVGLYAQLGSRDVIGVMASGSCAIEGKIGGVVEPSGGALTFTPEAELAPVRLQAKVLTRALFWKSEWSWDIVLTRQFKTRAEAPWKLFEFTQ